MLLPAYACTGHHHESARPEQADHVGHRFTPEWIVLHDFARYYHVKRFIWSVVFLAFAYDIDSFARSKVQANIFTVGEVTSYCSVNVQAANLQDPLAIKHLWEERLRDLDKFSLFGMRHKNLPVLN
jgi:hypothetical protein